MYNPRRLPPSRGSLLKDIICCLIPLDNVKQCTDMHQLLDQILQGAACLLIQGERQGAALKIVGYKSRTPEEPMTEAVIQGPQEGFTECLDTTISLLRRGLKTPNLALERFILGRVNQAKIIVAYIKGLASPQLVEEVRKRLQRIDMDAILESNYLEELIRDDPLSPFPQILATERPDRVIGGLLEGRVAIFTENTPFALIVPGELISHVQSSEDFYHHTFLSSFIRLMRWGALAVSLLLPGVYVAIVSYHQEMIPLRLLLDIASSSEAVPFPNIVEALLMEVSFEILREAGVRLPRAVGQAVSIVGALVIGEAAVTAGIVSPQMVIVVAMTGITSFISPSFALATSIRVLRFPILLFGGFWGFSA